MTDTNELLRDAAKRVQALANTAANNSDGDVLCCWDFEEIGGHERVIETRKSVDGTDQQIIAVPTTSGVAEHLAMWDPGTAFLVARLLLWIADPQYRVQARIHQAAVTLARQISGERAHEDAIESGSGQ